MHIDNLVLETTRNCNLRCAHCMRGNPQRLKMSNEVLWKTLQYVDSINSVTFTGGEPSLATDVIENFLDIIRWRNISVDFFYIVTNGKTKNGFRKFLDTVERLYNVCQSQDCCSLTISRDQYHLAEHTPNLWKFEVSDYGEYYPFFHPDIRKGNIPEPINEGRAAITQVGKREPEPQRPWQCREYKGSLQVMEEQLYISANGNVTSNCDMSFKRIDKESKGNVLTQSLESIIRSFCIIEQEEETIAV